MAMIEQTPPPAVQPGDQWLLRDGTRLSLRPLHVQDAERLGAMIGSLGAISRRHRFHAAVNPNSPHWLARLTHTDPAREWAVVVVREGRGEAEAASVVAEARLCCRECAGAGAGAGEGEFALVVADAWQRSGIGRRTVLSLLAEARRRGLCRVHADVMEDNLPMRSLLHALGFDGRRGEAGLHYVAALS